MLVLVSTRGSAVHCGETKEAILIAGLLEKTEKMLTTKDEAEDLIQRWVSHQFVTRLFSSCAWGCSDRTLAWQISVDLILFGIFPLPANDKHYKENNNTEIGFIISVEIKCFTSVNESNTASLSCIQRDSQEEDLTPEDYQQFKTLGSACLTEGASEQLLKFVQEEKNQVLLGDAFLCPHWCRSDVGSQRAKL